MQTKYKKRKRKIKTSKDDETAPAFKTEIEHLLVEAETRGYKKGFERAAEIANTVCYDAVDDYGKSACAQTAAYIRDKIQEMIKTPAECTKRVAEPRGYCMLRRI